MKNGPSIDEQLEIYRRMIITRRLEERLGDLNKAGKTRGPIHRCDGQEAVGVAATAMLTDNDFITSTHRGHAHYVGKGLDVYKILAEILGRETGYCKGRAGHMLVADVSRGMIGGNAIVGASIPAATGMALSMQVQGRKDVAMCFFGDGASHTGIAHESMNMASLWKLPVVFVLEHNQFGLTVHHSVQSAVSDLSLRGAGYAIPSEIVDGNDAVAVYRAVSKAVDRARRGEGPTLIEAKTYRIEGFSTSDMGGYQSDEDIKAWKKHDPIKISFDALKGEVGEDKLIAIDKEATAEVEAAVEKALSDPYPTFELHPASAAYSEAR
ncbi:thiamine pyrophosphate-dependent dehydrogenase E1 component subunit alpha [Brucella gallinifaecis]|uniref:Thiamine pyrophosphate-dependent dehydrogenase E1 component subunit alpha n=1 Tax=Brucella gallinifaecis TaxID=215590 RepID=A0A502BJN0_9HYPH|nr:thiamine pyrophosphate-dependent dehydrogenase E1 component subunit alpha [Brucella gallinifaecis]TPF74702.1 thiamine pyrophosphate-dependent dehydrogenase E1 component subunit alpha [Brucella gallinifaecis]